MRKTFYDVQPNNVHLEKLIGHFGKLDQVSHDSYRETNFVFLCYTNRCGSNYIAEMLSSSGKYNCAGEDLNWETVINHSSSRNLASFEEYFSFLVKRLNRTSLVFIKLAIPHIELLGRSGILDQIIDRSSFVLIERSDKLGQAISVALAFGTGRFTSLMTGLKDPEEIPFSKKQLENIITDIAEQYRRFDMFFAKNGLVPFNLVYEQMLVNSDMHLEALAYHLGLQEFAIKRSALRLKQQSNTVNHEWRASYLATSN